MSRCEPPAPAIVADWLRRPGRARHDSLVNTILAVSTGLIGRCACRTTAGPGGAGPEHDEWSP